MDYIRKNETLVETWIDDTSTHSIEDRYVRAMLASMLEQSRNPNRAGYTGPMTIELCERWAVQEQYCADHDRRLALCSASAEVLGQLARKLHAP